MSTAPKKQNGFTLPEMTMVILFVFMVIGYSMNIYKFMHICCTTVTGEIIVRGIGLIVFPLGSIAGYF